MSETRPLAVHRSPHRGVHSGVFSHCYSCKAQLWFSPRARLLPSSPIRAPPPVTQLASASADSTKHEQAAMHDASGPTPGHQDKPSWGMTFSLAYGALGVIYGDIGTSPLYTFSSIFSKVEYMAEEDVLMGVSLIFWSMTLVVLIKYVGVVLHANDQGEGSTIALYSNLCRVMGLSPAGDSLGAQDHNSIITLARRASLARASAISSHRGLPAWGTLQSPVGHQDLMKKSKTDSNPDPEDEPDKVFRPRWWNVGAFPDAPLKSWFRRSRAAQATLVMISIIAPAMEMGDGVLTPAVSVVSAVSGLKEGVASVDANAVMGTSIAILVLLFSVQFKGTGKIAFLFSPIVGLWLTANAAIGIFHLSQSGAHVLKGLSPYYIYAFFAKFGTEGWAMLGSVMLAVTGAEAMFSDLGHFSIGGVVVSWLGCVYPCLVLTYAGQGAYLLKNLADISTVYWSSVPKPVFWPMLILATLASVVASQALISACFQICKQARALDFFPCVKIVHTSKDQTGQIYVGVVNWALMVLSILVVVGFQGNSDHMSNAYGLTISMVMLVSTFMVTLVMILNWRLSAIFVLAFAVTFGIIDGAFVSANLTKVPRGGWVAIAITAGLALMNTVWWLGQRRRQSVLSKQEDMDLAEVFTVILPRSESRQRTAVLEAVSAPYRHGPALMAQSAPHTLPQLALTMNPDQPLVTLPGVGLYYSTTTYSMPAVMRHFIRNVAAVHEVNIFLCVRHLPIPFLADSDRLLVHVLPTLPNTYQAMARYGYMESVDHRQEFINQLVEKLVASIERRVRAQQEQPPTPAVDGAAPRHESLLSPAGLDTTLSTRSTVAMRNLPLVEDQAVVEEPPEVVLHVSDEITPAADNPRANLQMPYESPRVHMDLSRLSRAIELSSLSRFSRYASTPDALAAGLSHGLPSLTIRSTAPAVNDPAVEEAALRIAHLQSAAAVGVIYYVGRTSLRMLPDSNVLHNVLYDNLYKPMLSLSYAETDTWQVPVSNLVELGMVLHI